jgi:hypothetical protein
MDERNSREETFRLDDFLKFKQNYNKSTQLLTQKPSYTQIKLSKK